MSSSFRKTLRRVFSEKFGLEDVAATRSEFPLRRCPGCGIYSRTDPGKCRQCTDEQFLRRSVYVVHDLDDDYLKSREQVLDFWNRVLAECQKSEKLFVDETFPSSAASVFYDAQSVSAAVRWDRPSNNPPTDVADSGSHEVFSAGFWPDRNCWFLDALRLVSERPDILRSVILTEEVCPEAAYVVRLCKDGRWVPIIVDDFLPFAPLAGQLLMPIIEKAAAKLCGTYEALTVGGDLCDGLEMLTGASTQSTSLIRKALDIDDVWNELMDDYENEFLIAATSNEFLLSDEKSRPDCLLSRRNYAVLKVSQDGLIRRLELCLPSAQSDVRRGDRDPVFHMDYGDFLQCFDALHVCRVRPDWTEVRVEGTLPSRCSTDEADVDVPIRRLNVAERTSLDVTIYQNSQREKSMENRCCSTDISIVIFTERSGHDIEARVNFADVVCYSPRSTQGSVSLRCRLDPGAYLITCLSVNSILNGDAVRGDDEFVMAVRSPTPLLPMRRLQFSNCALTDAFIRLTMVKGSPAIPAILTAGINAYVFRKDWHGLIMLIENTVRDKFAVVNFSSRLSDSVTATRSSTPTKDYVPPGSRRLVAVVTAKKWDRLDEFSIGSFVMANSITQKVLGEDDSAPKFGDRVKGLHVPRPMWLT